MSITEENTTMTEDTTVYIKSVDYIKVLYNFKYGGFGLSDKAVELYNKKKAAIDPEHKYNKHCMWVCRHDPELIETYEELGKEFGDKYCDAHIVRIHKKYEDHYDFREYDGLETVFVDYTKYKFGKTKEILDSDMSNDEKVEKMKEIYEEENYALIDSDSDDDNDSSGNKFKNKKWKWLY